ncbi:hypothetical protein KAX22_02360 [bacterium]|nr:hypothetical protein [bacterium]
MFRFMKSRMWSFGDIAILKTYCAVLGIIVGAYIASFVKSYLWLFILVAVVLLIRLVYFVFFKKQ